MAFTLLSTLINRMNRYQSAATVEEQYKVRDLDDAIRTLKRAYNLPWYMKRGSLKVFYGVYEYAPAADHDYLVYLERQPDDIGYARKLRARYTTLQGFYEDPDYRNQVAEIWNNGQLILGVRKKNTDLSTLQNTTLDTCEATTGYTASGDASNIQNDLVNYKEGTQSIRFTVTASSGTALVEKTLDAGSTNTNYKSMWHFRWVYLDTVPTSVTLRFGANNANYLHATVTTQFNGLPLAAAQWNLLAFDLNSAATVGTINTATVFAYDAVQLNGAASGVYNIDAAYIRSWELLDYWYYSKYAVMTSSSTVANQESFFNASDVYATDSSLVGDSEWADVIMYDALCTTMIDKENQIVLNEIKGKRELAWGKLQEKWPDLKPSPTTVKYRFDTSYEFPTDLGYWR